MGGHAIVVGGSVGGLLAAAALAETYTRVTVLDRDALPDEGIERRAVPQGRHAHCLLPRGCAHLESLLPGLGDEMVAAGAPTCDALEELRWILNGHELARASTGLRTILGSRPFLEGHVRRRVRALPGVELVPHCDVLDLVGSRGRVTGVRVARDGLEQAIEADLVVCASGRSAQVPAWLDALGHAPPRHERFAVDIRYASRRLRPAPGALGGDRIVMVGARPGRARGLVFFAQEDDHWLLTLIGYGAGHRPPDDDAGFFDFAATVAPPDVAQAIREAEPLGPIDTMAFPASRRWRYDRLAGFPDGLLVTGDAITSFNPHYGQGVTVASAQAVALRDCLRKGERALARRYFAAAWGPTDDAWRLSTGADLALPEVRGHRPPSVRAVNRYVRRLHAVAEHDTVAAAAFVNVVAMHERPAHLFRPALRVALRRRRLAPHEVDERAGHGQPDDGMQAPHLLTSSSWPTWTSTRSAASSKSDARARASAWRRSPSGPSSAPRRASASGSGTGPRRRSAG
jgi:2-polyprenyl-6-methoxyphenol hydroxylase-like FAD-dependent oxidoreductase